MVVERKELWGVGKHFMLFKIGVERQNYGTERPLKLFLGF